jgi:hypothetical protein
MVTLFPMTTSFSIKHWALMLQFEPIRAPGSTTENCQIWVPFPMDTD